ncbi:hypothetical protein pE33L466_0285 (plasmid) [Bacillus cereus E33L]|uniref:Uncharacterized protein n=1 Tax=Bacillus cereus (strain ZK / E33L) TaxID=288681 RepID=Q4V1H0_BACCZ|nr:hypothetical protein pE33L466_0285 [Bacillus cereus E33L]
MKKTSSSLFCNIYLNPSILLYIATPAKNLTLNSKYEGLFNISRYTLISPQFGESLHFLPVSKVKQSKLEIILI